MQGSMSFTKEDTARVDSKKLNEHLSNYNETVYRCDIIGQQFIPFTGQQFIACQVNNS